ncbi:hypothetical protein BD770DRAFT_312079 [Pilaira anomala]|nr:hypothetical protein BD770DRAFT_312079 [Pilaira anomala]
MKPKSNFKKKTKNTDILSAGSKIYAKKRKVKKETVESVDFDPVKRTEKYALLAKEEKLRNRKEIREQRQALAEKNVQEMAAMLRVAIGAPETEGFESEEEEGKEEAKKEPVVQEFKNKTTLTTVTVIEDLDLDNP